MKRAKTDFRHKEPKKDEWVDITNHPDRDSIENTLLVEGIKKTFPEDWEKRIEKLK